MKKSHPIRRVLLASAATVSGIVLLLTLKPSSDPAAAEGQSIAPQGQAGAQAVADGTMTGAVEQTDYGPVQVRVTMNGGKITKAEAVQKPEGGRSTQISNDAIPKLNQAAVAAGNADIDAVSGATYTSAGYKKSLQSALDKAGSAQGSGAQESGGQEAGTERESGSAEAGAGAGAGAGGAQVAGETLQGEVVKTEYGPVQVRVTLSGGKIVKAEAVQMPMGGRSTQVSGNAIPKLNQAAVTAGSADIDAVSGATYTSAGYEKSLQSALDNAG
jgi:uncharacterized protein with FMN-binding domain